MNKLLFYADYINFKHHSASITGASYRKLQWGPVPDHHGMLRDLMELDGYISLREKTYRDCVGIEFTAGPRALELEMDYESPEIEILNVVADALASARPGR